MLLVILITKIIDFDNGFLYNEDKSIYLNIYECNEDLNTEVQTADKGVNIELRVGSGNEKLFARLCHQQSRVWRKFFAGGKPPIPPPFLISGDKTPKFSSPSYQSKRKKIGVQAKKIAPSFRDFFCVLSQKYSDRNKCLLDTIETTF